jgi:hypothetical protein
MNEAPVGQSEGSSMIRFLFRLAGQIALAVALVFAVADIARSLANEAVSLTTLADAAAAMRLPLTPAAPGAALDAVVLVSGWPAAAVLGLLAFVLLFLGRRPGR